MRMLIPKRGSLERILLEAMLNGPVTFLEMEGTGITEENIDSVANNLKTGMYESEQDQQLEKDS